MTANGIDVSNNQGGVLWPAVAAAGYQFGLVKASEGTGFADAFLPANWNGMGLAQMGRSAYHFARPDLDPSPAPEAAWFLKCLGAVLLITGDGAMLDLELAASTYQDLGPWALGWLQTVEQALGFKPLIYTSPGFAVDHNLGAYPELGNYGLVVADWGVTQPTVPAPWSFYACWQTSATGSVPGVTGACDLDVFNGTLAQFKQYGLPAPIPVPVPPTPPPAPPVVPVFDNNAYVELTRRTVPGSGAPLDPVAAYAWLAQFQPNS